jgi:hypothetical protein
VDNGTPVVNRKKWHVFNDAATYYFSVVDIKGNHVKVTSYGGISSPYQVIDHFSITR